MKTSDSAFQKLAINIDSQGSSTPFQLGKLWQALSRGALRFRDACATSERYIAILAAPADPEPLNQRKLRLFEQILLGTPPKVVAIDSRISLSSVTAATQDTLHAMGLPHRGLQASVILTMAARALHQPETTAQTGRMTPWEHEGHSFLVLSAERPDLHFPVALSSAEAEVLRHLLAGASYAEISGARAVSRCTVGTQLATEFRMLGVSGRRATIGRLFEHGRAERQLATGSV